MTATSIFLKPAARSDLVAPWLQSLGYVLSVTISVVLVSAFLPFLSSSVDEGGSEVVIEFASIVTEAASEATAESADVAADDQQATPEIDEVKSLKSEDERPTEQVSPSEPVDADLAMARERTQQEQDYKTEDRQATEAMLASTQSVSSAQSSAAEARSGQLTDDEQRLAAQEGVSDAQSRRRLESWQRKLFTHIGRHKNYPEEARAKGLVGEVVVAFEIDRFGNLMSVRVVQSSGSKLLDDAALEVMKRSSPVPPLPAEVSGTSLRLTLPLKFSLSAAR